MDKQLDVEHLRKDLTDYFGTFASIGMPQALMDIVRVEKASEEELLEIAKENRFSVSKYYI